MLSVSNTRVLWLPSLRVPKGGWNIKNQRATQGEIETRRERPVAVLQWGSLLPLDWGRGEICVHMPLLWDPTVPTAVPEAGTLLIDVKSLLFFFFLKYFPTYLLFFSFCLFCTEPNCLTNCPLGTLALPASCRKCFLPSFQTFWRGHLCNLGLASDTKKQGRIIRDRSAPWWQLPALVQGPPG